MSESMLKGCCNINQPLIKMKTCRLGFIDSIQESLCNIPATCSMLNPNSIAPEGHEQI